MKKIIKSFYRILLIILGIIISSILFDTLNAYIFRKSPIISKQEVLEDYNYVDRGILFNVYYCHHSPDLVYVDWVLKPFHKTCPPIKYENMIDIINHVFIKTYFVEKVDYIDDNKINLELSQSDGEKNVNITINSEFELKKNVKYEILFKVTSNNIRENIESIFKHSEILDIKKTDKDINQFIR